MKLRSLALLFSFVLLASATLAHGDFKHVIGTIEKTSADSVTVKTADGSSVEVKLVASTNYVMRSGGVNKPAKLSDLAVGDRVVIHARPKGDTLEAAEVTFSAPAPAAAASSPKS
ncbi:MAG: hypothetical protein WBG02_14855 [Candidatus Acidiferrum sp.]